MKIKEYLFLALSEKTEVGDKILIPCADKREQDSIRSSLLYFRKLVEKEKPELAKLISIFREDITCEDSSESKESKTRFFVALQKRDNNCEAIIIKKDGKIKELNGEELSIDKIKELGLGIEEKIEINYDRIVETAIQDKLSLSILLKELKVDLNSPKYLIIQDLYLSKLKEAGDSLFSESSNYNEKETESANFASSDSL